MKRGPKPMSAAERSARGNPGKRKSKPDTTPPVRTISVGDSKVQRPSWLTGELARKTWDQVAGDLIAAKFVRSTDVVALARYCQYVVDWIEANKVTSKMKVPVYETDTNHGKMLRIHPASIIRSRLEDDLVKLESVLGLTPRDRHQLMKDLAAQPQVPPGGMFNPNPGDVPDVPPPDMGEPKSIVGRLLN